MVFKEIADRFPSALYLAVIGAAAVFVIWVAVVMIRLAVRTGRLRRDISEIVSGISMQQGCQIENLPLISDIFESFSGRLRSTFTELMQGAADHFHKRWIPDPRSYLNTSTLTDASDRSIMSRIGYLRFLTAGLSLSLISTAAALYFSDSVDSLRYALWLGFLPMAVTVITVMVFRLVIISTENKFERSVDSLVRVICLKVPVFSDNAGVSLLVSQFIEYDRNMSGSVSLLSDKLDRFTSDGLVNAVSSSIEDTLREAVFPSIERNNDAILALAKDISSREDEGMKKLALNFASSVTSELSYHLRPLVAQIESLSHSLSDSKNYIDVISKNINSYKQSASDLQVLTKQTLAEYEESRRTFSADIASIASSLKQQSEINREYKEIVTEDVGKFQNSISSLNSKLEESDKTLKVMLDAIFVEARNAEENAAKAQSSAADYLSSMKDQIRTLTEQLSLKNNALISDLDKTITQFFNKQEEHLGSQNAKLADKTVDLLNSMETSASAIHNSTAQIKAAFDELEEARRREEEAKAKKSIFKRNK